MLRPWWSEVVRVGGYTMRGWRDQQLSIHDFKDIEECNDNSVNFNSDQTKDDVKRSGGIWQRFE